MPDPIPTNSSTPPVLPNVIPSDSSLPPVLPVERSRGPVQKYPPPPGPIRPYASLGEMKAAHTLLQRRRRSGFAKDPTLSAEIVEFLYRGHATGALLGSEDERYHAQGLLTYWSNILYRRGGEVEDDSLARFDATRAPDLTGTENPFRELGRPTGAGPAPGWERLVGEAVRAVRDNGVTGLVGASGSGRFALVHDGLLPVLRAGAVPGSQGWDYLPPFTPGPDPLTRLVRAFGEADPGVWAARLARNPRAAAQLGAGRGRPAVVLVERFDELFRRADLDQARAFAAALLALADAGPGHRVVLVSDANGLGPLDGLGPMAKRFRQGQVLVTFTAGELRQMVVEPAERVGLRFDDGLVDRLLMDVQGDPGVLALLRFTLRRLWEARERNRITHEAYDRVGGGRLAVGRAAEQFFAPLSDDDKAAAQRLLLRLIQPATGTGVTCRRQPRDRLVPPAEAGHVSGRVLDKLVEAGLVVPVKSGGDAAPEYAPVHESLATAWPRFLKWLEDRRAEEQWRARLQAAAEEWQARGRKPETLWRGATLVLALQEAARLQAAGEPLDPLEQTFLDASLARHRLRRVAQSAALGAVGLGVLAFLGMWLWYEKSKNRILSDNLVLEEGLRTAETNLRRETALLNASWQGQEGARLAESGDTSGAFLWYARAWEQFDSVQDTVGEPDRSRLRANYLLQLGVASRQAPALAGMAYAGMAYDGFATVARTPDGSLALAARKDADANVDRPIARIWRWSEADRTWSAPEDLPGLAGRGLTEMSGAYVSDDGHLVAVAATDRQGAARVYVWDLPAPGAAVGPRESTFLGRFKEAALSPDGKFLAVVSSPSEAAKAGPARGAREPTERVTVWRTNRIAEPLELPVPRDVGPLGGLTFSPHSDRLALGVGSRPADGPEPVVCLEWPVSAAGPATSPKTYTGARDRSSGPRGEEQWAVAYSPHDGGGLLLVANGREGDRPPDAWLFTTQGDTRKGRELSVPHRGPIVRAAFSPDGARLATAGADGAVWIWKVARPAGGPAVADQLRALGDPSAGPTSPAGGTFAGAAGAQAHDARVFDVAFSRSGERVATASRDRRARVWDVATGRLTYPSLYHTGSVDQAGFVGDDQLLTTSQGVVYRWDLSRGAPHPVTARAPGSLPIVVTNPGGRAVLAAGERPARPRPTGWAQLWDARTGAPLTEVLAHSAAVRHAAVSPDARFASVVGADGSLALWTVAKPADQVLTVPAGDWPIVSTAFGHAGTTTYLLAVGRETVDFPSGPARARLWSIGSDGRPEEAPGFEFDAPLERAAFSPDGKRVVAFTGEGTAGEAAVWEVGSQTKPVRLRWADSRFAHAEAITSAQFSPSGGLVLTTGRDDEAVLWVPVGTGKWSGSKLRGRRGDVVERHTADVLFAAFDGTDDRVVTAGADRQAVVWKREGGEPFRPTVLLPLPAAPVQAAFTPDRRYVLTADETSTVRVWDPEDARVVVVRHCAGRVRQAAIPADAGSGLSVCVIGSEEARRNDPAPADPPAPPVPGGYGRLTFAHWDLSPAETNWTGQVRLVAELLAGRRLIDQGGFTRLTPLTADEVYERWVEAGGHAQPPGR